MRDKLIAILRDMSKCVFTNEEKADYLFQHDVVPVVRCIKCQGWNAAACECDYGVPAEEFDYCSFGKRKADNG